MQKRFLCGGSLVGHGLEKVCRFFATRIVCFVGVRREKTLHGVSLLLAGICRLQARLACWRRACSRSKGGRYDNEIRSAGCRAEPFLRVTPDLRRGAAIKRRKRRRGNLRAGILLDGWHVGISFGEIWREDLLVMILLGAGRLLRSLRFSLGTSVAKLELASGVFRTALAVSA